MFSHLQRYLVFDSNAAYTSTADIRSRRKEETKDNRTWIRDTEVLHIGFSTVRSFIRINENTLLKCDYVMKKERKSANLEIAARAKL